MSSKERGLHAGQLYPAGVSGVREHFVVTRSGLRVRVVEAGHVDAPPIVFVPGWACTAWIFHDTLRAVAKSGFRAITVELKGHGLSDKPSSPTEYTLPAMRDHLIEILDALALERCGLVGHSMGAAIAVAAASREPSRVSGIVLAAPVGFAGVRFMSVFRAITPKLLEPILPALASKRLVRMMLSVVYGSLRRASLRDVEEFHAPIKSPGYTSALRNLLHGFEWRARFPALAMPWLTIVGSEDVLSPANDVARYAGANGEGRSVVIQGAGHVLFDEAPDEVNSLLSEFFSELRAPYISSTND
jgi:pimeloyl-ACP methyl ester carboxylesterase